MGDTQQISPPEETKDELRDMRENAAKYQTANIDEWLQQGEAGPSTTRPLPPRRQKSLPATPPRPSNAWILYRADIMRALETDTLTPRQQEVCEKVKRELADIAPATANRSGQQLGNISRIASAMWRAEEASVRNAYTLRSENVRQRHREMYPDYKFKPRRRQTVGREGAEAARQSSGRVGGATSRERLANPDSRTASIHENTQDTQWTSASSTSSGDYERPPWSALSPTHGLTIEQARHRRRSQSSPLCANQDPQALKDLRSAIPIMIPELRIRQRGGIHTGESTYLQQMTFHDQNSGQPVSPELARVVGDQGSRAHPFLPPRRHMETPSLPSAPCSSSSFSVDFPTAPATGVSTTSDFADMASPSLEWMQSQDPSRGWSSAAASYFGSGSTSYGTNSFTEYPPAHGGEFYSMSAPAWQAHFPGQQMVDSPFINTTAAPTWRMMQSQELVPQQNLRPHAFVRDYTMAATTGQIENMQSHQREIAQTQSDEMLQHGVQGQVEELGRPVGRAAHDQSSFLQPLPSWASQTSGARASLRQDDAMTSPAAPMRYDAVEPQQRDGEVSLGRVGRISSDQIHETQQAAVDTIEDDVMLSNVEMLRKLYDQSASP